MPYFLSQTPQRLSLAQCESPQPHPALISSYTGCLSFPNTVCYLSLKCLCPPCPFPTLPTNLPADIFSLHPSSTPPKKTRPYKTRRLCTLLQGEQALFHGLVFSMSALLLKDT